MDWGLIVPDKTDFVFTPLTSEIWSIEDTVFVIAVVVLTVNVVPIIAVFSLDLEEFSYHVEATIVSIPTLLVLTKVTPLLPVWETTNDSLDIGAVDKVDDWV